MSDCTELIPIYDQRCLTINAPGHDWSYDTDNTQTTHQKHTKLQQQLLWQAGSCLQLLCYG